MKPSDEESLSPHLSKWATSASRQKYSQVCSMQALFSTTIHQKKTNSYWFPCMKWRPNNPLEAWTETHALPAKCDFLVTTDSKFPLGKPTSLPCPAIIAVKITMSCILKAYIGDIGSCLLSSQSAGSLSSALSTTTAISKGLLWGTFPAQPARPNPGPSTCKVCATHWPK